MKFTLKNAREFGWEGLKGWAYNTKDDFADTSAAIFEVTDSHGKVKSTKSDRVYLVLEGKGQFMVGNEKNDVEKDDVIIIPKNSPYDYKAVGGKLKLFLVHAPAYDEKTEVKLDN